jgi:tetratricopeptide (TPR) repeat protein
MNWPVRRLATGLVAYALLAACSEWRMRPLTAPYSASAPLIQEQALLGLDAEGNAAALQLVEAEGMAASLTLWRLDRDGGPSRVLLTAPAEVASQVASAVREAGHRQDPLLFEAAKGPWVDAFARANALGFERLLPGVADPGTPEHAVAGPGGFVGSLRTALVDGDPPAFVVLLGENGAATDRVEIARQPVAGAPFQAGLWVRGSVAWLLSGSIGQGDPLRRTLALRRGSISHGIAEIHFARARADRAKGNVESARTELGLAIAADPRFVDALYAAAAADAVSGRAEAAVSLLRRAAQVDARRVQVLGRDDEDLVSLRGRPDVRKLLGLPRPEAG